MPENPVHIYEPFANLPHEFEVGQIVRNAVDHDPEKMRFYLTCSVGELAQRIAAYIATAEE